MLVDINCDIYITGSNAYLLSSELTTLLAGRVLTIKIYPFKENEDKYNKFDKYLKFGGMSMLVNMNDNEELMINYLNDIKEVVLKNCTFLNFYYIFPTQFFFSKMSIISCLSINRLF